MIWYKVNHNKDPYRELWSRKEWLNPIKNAASIKFPLIITVEPTNICQYKCLYCSRQLMNRKEGMMSIETMELISKEASEHHSAIRHGGFGEPLLHPGIVDLIRVNKENKILTTIFTNGNLLTEDMMREFVDLGLDEIRFSTSGITPETHNEIRKKSDYHRDFEEKVKMAYEVRGKMKSKYPFITVYSNVIDYQSKIITENIESYKSKYMLYADKIDIDLTDFSRVKHLEHVKELYKSQRINEEYKPCVILYLKVIVHWNGDVFGCDCVYNFEDKFYIGTIGKDNFTIEKGYLSPKMQELRKQLGFSLNHNQFELCKCCYANTNKWDKNQENLRSLMMESQHGLLKDLD